MRHCRFIFVLGLAPAAAQPPTASASTLMTFTTSSYWTLPQYRWISPEAEPDTRGARGGGAGPGLDSPHPPAYPL